MKYSEDSVLIALHDHIEGTYKDHYQSENGIQALDVWEALGNFDTSCRDAAIKYLFRFGKKNGENKEDLLKAMHFITLLYWHKFLKPQPPANNVIKLKEVA